MAKDAAFLAALSQFLLTGMIISGVLLFIGLAVCAIGEWIFSRRMKTLKRQFQKDWT